MADPLCNRPKPKLTCNRIKLALQRMVEINPVAQTPATLGTPAITGNAHRVVTG